MSDQLATISHPKKEPINITELDQCIVFNQTKQDLEPDIQIRLFSECMMLMSLRNEWKISNKFFRLCVSKLEALMGLFLSMSNPKLFGSKNSEQKVGTMFDIVWKLFIQIVIVFNKKSFKAIRPEKTVNHTLYDINGRFKRCQDIDALANGSCVKKLYWGENPMNIFIEVMNFVITECKNLECENADKKIVLENNPAHAGHIYLYVLPKILKEIQGGAKHRTGSFDLRVLSELVGIKHLCNDKQEPIANYSSKIKNGEIVRTTMFVPMKEELDDIKSFPLLPDKKISPATIVEDRAQIEQEDCAQIEQVDCVQIEQVDCAQIEQLLELSTGKYTPIQQDESKDEGELHNFFAMKDRSKFKKNKGKKKPVIVSLYNGKNLVQLER